MGIGMYQHFSLLNRFQDFALQTISPIYAYSEGLYIFTTISSCKVYTSEAYPPALVTFVLIDPKLTLLNFSDIFVSISFSIVLAKLSSIFYPSYLILPLQLSNRLAPQKYFSFRNYISLGTSFVIHPIY